MTPPHPASLILLGLATLFAASSRDGLALYLGGLMLTFLALAASRSHFCLLLRRSRWLLLTMLVMFGWLTPGTPMDVPGASQEGLLLAADNIARLLVALATVALLLKAVPIPELVVGMRSLLAPLDLLGIPRDRIAVRLALTLDAVETARKGDSREAGSLASTLSLPAPASGATDLAIFAFIGVLAIAVLLP